jgi:hypothetical protein
MGVVMRAKADQIETWWDIAHYRGEIRRSRHARSIQFGLGVVLAAFLLWYVVGLI